MTDSSLLASLFTSCTIRRETFLLTHTHTHTHTHTFTRTTIQQMRAASAEGALLDLLVVITDDTALRDAAV